MIKLSLKVRIVLRIETILMKILVRIINYSRKRVKKEFEDYMQIELASRVDEEIYKELMKNG